MGAISPDDARARRFGELGAGSCLCFPPGPSFGERWISIGKGTLIGPSVALTVGLPGEDMGPTSGAVIRIGDGCNVGRGSSLVGREGIVIEDHVTTGPNVYITDHNHSYDDLEMPIGRQWLRSAPVRIGAGSWLGAGVIVLPGADIGRHVVVGAGSVVRGKVEDGTVVAGAPAHVVRHHVEGQGWIPPIPANPRPAPEDWPAA